MDKSGRVCPVLPRKVSLEYERFLQAKSSLKPLGQGNRTGNTILIGKSGVFCENSH